ncbi:MAG: hypothetical protein LBB91_09375 [Clostridiales bacterium]|jgi:hypothetical protein|nr:hypothetical protein [Clostridiales bacterium]
MRFELVDFDKDHYAANIQNSGEMLRWDTRGSTHHLIIRADFGANISFDAESKTTIEKFDNARIFSQKEIRFDNQGNYFLMLPKSHLNNYRFRISPAAYGVFCCEYDKDTDICRLYLPNEACLYQCNVAASIMISIEKEKAKKGFWGLAKKGSGPTSYIINIPLIPNYSDGLLYYTYDGYAYQFPVTKRMLNKPLSIPALADKPPLIKAAPDHGYVVVSGD